MPTHARELRPRRIQRRRVKGWRMPIGAVYVGRGSKWGNPFRVSRLLCRENAMELFEALFGIEGNEPMTSRQKFFEPLGKHYPVADLAELRGKDLVCWCRLDQECHADVLLEIANADRRTP